MKMAKATEQDREQANTLAGMLGDLFSGNYPRNAKGEFPENGPEFFDEDDKEHLRFLSDEIQRLDIGAINRVIFGFDTVCGNDVFAPNLDHLEWHPDLQPIIHARQQRSSGNRMAFDATVFRHFQNQLKLWKQQYLPHLTVVNVDCERFKGQAIVVADSDCAPENVDCRLENGNTWWYPIESVTIISDVRLYDRWVRRELTKIRREEQNYRNRCKLTLIP